MNIREALAKEHSKRNTEAIVTFIGSDPERFADLVDLFKTEDHRMVQRASWPLSYVVANSPELVYPYLGRLIAMLDQPLHDAYKRNVFRLLRGMKNIPEQHHAELIDRCMHAITNVREPAAVRAFAIHIMGKLAQLYPELSGELLMILEPLTSHELPSIRSSATNVTKQIHKKMS